MLAAAVICSVLSTTPRGWRLGPWPLRLIELGGFGYLLTIPLGRDAPDLLRNLLLLLLGAGLLASARSRSAEGAEAFRYKLLIPFGIFVAASLLSTLASSDPALSVERSSHTPIAMLFFFAAQHIASDRSALRRLQLVLCGVLLLLGIDGVWQTASGASLLSGSQDHLLYRGRATGSLPHPNDLALIPILMPFGVSLVVRDRCSGVRLLALASLVLAISTSFLSQSRNAWLGCAIALGTLLLLGRSWKLALGVSAAAAAVLAVLFAADIANLRTKLGSLASPHSEGRFGLWSVAWRMFAESPVLGKGVHMFGEFYANYLANVDLPARFVREARPIPWPHNLYLELLAERGVVGFAAFGLVVSPGVARATRAARARPPFSQAAALVASLATFLAMSSLDLTFYKDWVALVFWFLIGLAAQVGAPDAGSCSREAA